MSLTQTVAPTVLPVSVSDLKTHLRLLQSDTSEDAALTDWIWAAADLFTRSTGRQLTQATYRLQLDTIPEVAYLPRFPVSSVTACEYLNSGGSWVTATYLTDFTTNPARVFLTEPTDPWPYDGPKLRITFVAGDTLASSCPRLAVQGVKLLAAHWYKQSVEAFSDSNPPDVPTGWAAIVAQYQANPCYDANGGSR